MQKLFFFLEVGEACMLDVTIPISRDEAVVLLGPGEENLRVIEERMGVRITSRGGMLKISVPGVTEREKIEKLFTSLRDLLHDGRILTQDDVHRQIDGLGVEGSLPSHDVLPADLPTSPIVVNGRRGAIRTKTRGQLLFYEAIQHNDVVFAIGPAGTGKTFLAVAAALQALQTGEIDRIILTRPAIEAGESLGFLPGDLKEKIDPYLRPIHDALHDILSKDKFQYYMQNEVIEIAPIAFMRGRTLNNAYAILDEAQNCTVGQMKMFLTRLGINSKALVTGDVTQIDLQRGIASGLVEIQKILRGIKGIAYCYFDTHDVVRHTLVRKIIDAYAEYENGKQPSVSKDPKSPIS